MDALEAVLDAAFELTDHEVLRNRVLVAEQSLAGLHRTSAREEESRQLARSEMRDLEFAWATFLTRGMEQGAIPQADPRLLARAILGLYNSVWHWYRPRGSLSLEEVREFFVGRCLAVAGLPAGGAGEAEGPAKRKACQAQGGFEEHRRRAADDVAVDQPGSVDARGGDERRQRRAVDACLAEHELDATGRGLAQHVVRPGGESRCAR